MTDCAALAARAVRAAAASPDYDGDLLFVSVRAGDAFGFADRGYPGGGMELATTLAGHITACLRPQAWAPGDLVHTTSRSGGALIPPDRVTRVADAARAAIDGAGAGALVISVHEPARPGERARSGFYRRGYGPTDAAASRGLAEDLTRIVNALLGLPVELTPELIAEAYRPSRR